MSLRSAAEAPLCTSALKPPTKSTPTSLPALSMATAMGVRSVRVRGGADLGNGRDGYALVHDGDAVFALQLLGGGNQAFGRRGHAVVDLAGHGVHAGIGAAAQVQAQRDGADVQVLLAHHGERLGYFSRRDLHGIPLCRKQAPPARADAPGRTPASRRAGFGTSRACAPPTALLVRLLSERDYTGFRRLRLDMPQSGAAKTVSTAFGGVRARWQKTTTFPLTSITFRRRARKAAEAPACVQSSGNARMRHTHAFRAKAALWTYRFLPV